MSKKAELIEREKAPLSTPSDIGAEAVRDITGALNALLADAFSLYLKTKNFHWHMSGPHFRDYHLLLDDHGDQRQRVEYRVRADRDSTGIGGSSLGGPGDSRRSRGAWRLGGRAGECRDQCERQADRQIRRQSPAGDPQDGDRTGARRA